MAEFLTDTFTDTDLTPLDLHMPEVGGSWEPLPFTTSDVPPGDADPSDPEEPYFAALVYANQLITRSDNKRTPTYRQTVDPGSDEYDISLTWQLRNHSSAFHWLCWRMSPTGTADDEVDRYMLVADVLASRFELWRTIGGTPNGRVLLDTYVTPIINTVFNMRVEVRNDGMDIYSNDSLIISSNDTGITQRGRIGIGISAGNPSHYIDNLSATAIHNGYRYDAQWRKTGDVTWTYVKGIGTQPWTLSGLEEGSEYEAQFRAHDPETGQSSDWSASVFKTTSQAAQITTFDGIANGQPWPAPWTNPSGTATVQNDRGRLAKTATAWSGGEVLSNVNIADVRFAGSFVIHDAAQASYQIPIIRRSTDGDYYSAEFYVAGQNWEMKSWVGYTDTLLDSFGMTGIVTGSVVLWEFEAVGTTLQFRAWLQGSSKPATWQMSSTGRTEHTSGDVSITINSGNAAADYLEAESLSVYDLSLAPPPVQLTRTVGFSGGSATTTAIAQRFLSRLASFVSGQAATTASRGTRIARAHAFNAGTATHTAARAQRQSRTQAHSAGAGALATARFSRQARAAAHSASAGFLAQSRKTSLFRSQGYQAGAGALATQVARRVVRSLAFFGSSATTGSQRATRLNRANSFYSGGARFLASTAALVNRTAEFFAGSARAASIRSSRQVRTGAGHSAGQASFQLLRKVVQPRTTAHVSGSGMTTAARVLRAARQVAFQAGSASWTGRWRYSSALVRTAAHYASAGATQASRAVRSVRSQGYTAGQGATTLRRHLRALRSVGHTAGQAVFTVSQGSLVRRTAQFFARGGATAASRAATTMRSAAHFARRANLSVSWKDPSGRRDITIHVNSSVDRGPVIHASVGRGLTVRPGRLRWDVGEGEQRWNIEPSVTDRN